MTTQNQNQLSSIVAKVNSFSNTFEQIDSVMNSFNDEHGSSYLMLSLLNLLNDPSSKELGPSWIALVLKALFKESEVVIETLDDLDDIASTLYTAFETSNLLVPDDVQELLEKAFEILEVEYDL